MHGRGSPTQGSSGGWRSPRPHIRVLSVAVKLLIKFKSMTTRVSNIVKSAMDVWHFRMEGGDCWDSIPRNATEEVEA